MRLLLVSCSILAAAAAVYTPCFGKSRLGGECDINSDCEHKGSVCLRGRCRCHPHYIEVVDEKGNMPHCQLLPAKIGAHCTTKCREPLFCRNGGCQCVQRGTTTFVNGECVSVSRVGDRCTRHYDCTAPFSACLNQTCVCISGTIQQGLNCVAAANCPFGGLPGTSCVQRTAPGSAFNLPPGQSNCPAGQVCISAEDSAVGHCCPVVCPLASHVDTKYSCDPVALNGTRCPSDTHFCHLLSDGRFSQAVCCRRPCNAMAPNALYANHQCVPRGQLNAACSTNAQCGGGESMECSMIEEADHEMVVEEEHHEGVRDVHRKEASNNKSVGEDDIDDLIEDLKREMPDGIPLMKSKLDEDNDLLGLTTVKMDLRSLDGTAEAKREKRQTLWDPFKIFTTPRPATRKYKPTTTNKPVKKAPVKAILPLKEIKIRHTSTHKDATIHKTNSVMMVNGESRTRKGQGKTMKEFIGQCQCLRGFIPAVDSLTNPRSNPSQTCTRECSTMDLARDTSCFKKVSLGGQCFIQKQCPMNSGCYRGRCQCRCGFELKGKQCVPLPPPPTTTAAPSIPIPQGGELFSLFSKFLGGGGGAFGK